VNATALRELLAPPGAHGGTPLDLDAESRAEALLQRFRREEVGVPAATGLPQPCVLEALTAEAEDGLYAWGVLCYEQARHEDASALFHALLRRRHRSVRLLKAIGAVRLAQGRPADAAEAFRQAGELLPADAEVFFHQAQAEGLQSHLQAALELLGKARRLTEAAPGKWPRLRAWCDALQAQLEAPDPPTGRDTPFTEPTTRRTP
jgi:predicted Zn-dependent protease